MATDPLKNRTLTAMDASGRREPQGWLKNQSSHVRAREIDMPSRAARRVAEYLRTLGLCDAARIELLAVEASAVTDTENAEEHARRAIAHAQERVESWRAAVFPDFEIGPDPLWLRSFVSAHPDLFLGDLEKARARAREFGDAVAGSVPQQARFREQKLELAHVPNWLKGLAPPVLLTVGAALGLLVTLGADGLLIAEVAWTGLFAFLFGLGAVGFFTAARGFSRKASAPMARHSGALPRSALIMPIYHESPEQVFAALAAMRESLLDVPGGEAFEIFVLSDSRDPALAAEEERAFRRIATEAGSSVPIFYRRRAKNERQKAGNLADFFERWGLRYEYVVVLDADSLMTGETLVELVRRLHASPQLALLQAPIALSSGETLFARAMQFAGSLCGPIFTRGLAEWSGPDGNYYGHNAALRVRAFLDCCALPTLRGEPPLGGQIMSHDFVEAALLCRAGWEVRIAHDLSGSFEGLPPTLTEYVARDRRWCQGNLQHLSVALARGLKPMSRVHLLLGVFAYLAGPVWLAFLGVGVALASGGSAELAAYGVLITACTAVLLFAPRVLGLWATLSDANRRRAHGGAVRLVASTLFELVLSAWVAPLLMLHHTRIVLSILLGKAVGWGTQRRRGQGRFASSVRAELFTTLLGVAVPLALWFAAPSLVAWLSPIWLPWLLSMPIALVVSSRAAGVLTRRLGLLAVPTETEPHELLERTDELTLHTRGDESARFRDLVLDPVLVVAHLASLGDGASPYPAERLAELQQRALRAGPAGLTDAERLVLSSDAECMRFLHREAWRHWPVESWEIARQRPQVPPEAAAAVLRRVS